MFQLSLLSLVLWADILVGPFQVAEAQPKHHQVCVRAAMAPDGHFAVVWVDSLQLTDHFEMDMFIRFFDRDGSPMTDPYKIENIPELDWWIYCPHLKMDTAGNAVLVWVDPKTQSDEILSSIRFQRFGPDGSPQGPAKTLVSKAWIPFVIFPLGLSVANNGEFAITWDEGYSLPEVREEDIWVQRFDAQGNPECPAFRVHEDVADSLHFMLPAVALSEAGNLVVTWVDFLHPYPDPDDPDYFAHYSRFQVFDADNQSILPWEPIGHLVDEEVEPFDKEGRARVFWLDDDRFVAFWVDTYGRYLRGRVFTDRGLTRHPIRTLAHDSLAVCWVDLAGQFSLGFSSDERFAETHTRCHYDPGNIDHNWQHEAGVVGKIAGTDLWRRTTLFEYTPPWGKDTLSYRAGGPPNVQNPAVGACDDRIVWVYSRWNPDTVFETYVIISDWDMGEGVAEQPIVSVPSDWEIVTSIGPQIVLRYADRPDGFHASIFDATGRKVDELHATRGSGMIIWGRGYSPGVYFIRSVSDSPATTHKVILIQ